jgi:hypothetical protein
LATKKHENDTKKQGVTDSPDFTILVIHGTILSHCSFVFFVAEMLFLQTSRNCAKIWQKNGQKSACNPISIKNILINQWHTKFLTSNIVQYLTNTFVNQWVTAGN